MSFSDRYGHVVQCILLFLNISLMIAGVAITFTGIYARLNVVVSDSPVCTATICSGIVLFVFSYLGNRVSSSSNSRVVFLYIFLLIILLGANVYGLKRIYDLPMMTEIPYEVCQDPKLLNVGECYEMAMRYHFFRIMKYVCFGLIVYKVMTIMLLSHHAVYLESRKSDMAREQTA